MLPYVGALVVVLPEPSAPPRYQNPGFVLPRAPFVRVAGPFVLAVRPFVSALCPFVFSSHIIRLRQTSIRPAQTSISFHLAPIRFTRASIRFPRSPFVCTAHGGVRTGNGGPCGEAPKAHWRNGNSDFRFFEGPVSAALRAGRTWHASGGGEVVRTHEMDCFLLSHVSSLAARASRSFAMTVAVPTKDQDFVDFMNTRTAVGAQPRPHRFVHRADHGLHRRRRRCGQVLDRTRRCQARVRKAQDGWKDAKRSGRELANSDVTLMRASRTSRPTPPRSTPPPTSPHPSRTRRTSNPASATR